MTGRTGGDGRSADAPLGRLAVFTGLLAGATIVAFGNGLDGAFVFDDMGTIVRNGGIRTFPPGPDAEGPLGGLKYRIVGQWSLALNYALGGLDPAGYHVFNIAVHLVAGLLLFGLVRRTLRLPVGGGWAGDVADRLAFAAALVWLVHPLQTASVTYVIQRLEAMAGMFTVACLYAVLRGATGGRALPWYAAAAVASTLGMATKQSMIVAPVMVLLYDRIFLAPSWREVVARRWGLYAAFAPGLVWLLSTVPATVSDPASMAGAGISGLTPWSYLLSQPGVLLHYLRLTLWPDRLCLDYHWPLARTAEAIVPPGIAIGALLIASLVALRFVPGLGFLGLAFFLSLAPSSSLVPLADLAFEHRMYLALAPVAVALVLGVHALATRVVRPGRLRSALEVGVLVLVVLALVARTRARNRDYDDRATMWADVVACAPHNHRAHHNLGFYLLTEGGDRARAETALRRAIALAPDYGQPRIVLAAALRDAGKLDEAIVVLREGYAANPRDMSLGRGLADALAERGDGEGALAAYAALAAQAPNDPELLDQWGAQLVMLDRYAEAADRFRRAIAVAPTMAVAHTHLGVALELSGDAAGAIDAHRRALALPERTSATAVSRKALARLLASADPPELRDGPEAVRHAEQVVADEAEPDAASLLILAAAYAAAARPEDAARAAGRALEVATASGDEEAVRAAQADVERYGAPRTGR